VIWITPHSVCHSRDGCYHLNNKWASWGTADIQYRRNTMDDVILGQRIRPCRSSWTHCHNRHMTRKYNEKHNLDENPLLECSFISISIYRYSLRTGSLWTLFEIFAGYTVYESLVWIFPRNNRCKVKWDFALEIYIWVLLGGMLVRMRIRFCRGNPLSIQYTVIVRGPDILSQPCPILGTVCHAG
jgi:hypothetical protein